MTTALVRVEPAHGATTYCRPFRTFTALRDAVERTWEELNHVMSWRYVADGLGGQRFRLDMVMPANCHRTAAYGCDVTDRTEVDSWISTYLRPRVMRWYDLDGDA